MSRGSYLATAADKGGFFDPEPVRTSHWHTCVADWGIGGPLYTLPAAGSGGGLADVGGGGGAKRFVGGRGGAQLPD